jgi:periplasmic divalent cation tolerance protein
MLIVFTTLSSQQESEILAQKIVEAKLAACVQILPPMTSVYFWNDAVQKDSEVLLWIKTLTEKYESLEKFIFENHPYETPEIVAIEAEKISDSYLGWMQNYLK